VYRNTILSFSLAVLRRIQVHILSGTDGPSYDDSTAIALPEPPARNIYLRRWERVHPRPTN
jgi:hypothetical protein